MNSSTQFMSSEYGIRAYTAAELAALGDQPVVLLTEAPLRLVEAARNVIHGESNLGKTFFALGAAVELALAGHRVLVLVGEGAEGHTAVRLRGLCLARGAELAGLEDRLISVFGLGVIDEPEGEETLVALVERIAPALTIVDPLASYFLGDENKSEIVAKVLAVLDRVIALGSALLLVHHDRKTSRDTGRDMRGSSRIRAWADTIVGLEGRAGTVVLHDEKQRHLAKREPLAYALAFEPGGAIRINGCEVPMSGKAARKDRSSERAREVMRVLEHGPRNKHQLATTLHLGKATLDKILADLVSRGDVEERVERVRDAMGREREQRVFGRPLGEANGFAPVR
jgi:hypothetical protein